MFGIDLRKILWLLYSLVTSMSKPPVNKDQILDDDEIPRSNEEQVIFLSHEKIRHLVGKEGQNIRLIEYACKTKIKIKSFTNEEVFFDDDLPLNERKTEVTLICRDREKSFDDNDYKQNVLRFLRSATRGGFVKKLNKDEYDNLRNKKGGDIIEESSLSCLEDHLHLEIQYIGFENLVYVCVLEKMGVKRVKNGLDLENGISRVAEWIHQRYRNDRFAVPLKMDYQRRHCISQDNKITRKEEKRRESKRR